MSTPCGPCASIDNTNVCGQQIAIDNTTGDLTILPNGNTLNICDSVHLCETKTILQSVTLTGTILSVSYLGEDGVSQIKNVDLVSLITSSPANFTATDSNSINLHYGGGVLTANLIVDPTSAIPVSASSAGVYFGAPTALAVTTNNTNTIQLIASGTQGHTLTANLKYISSASILLSDTSSGLTAFVNYSTDAGNVATQGSDGGVYVQSVDSQISSYPMNGFATTGSSGTLLVGSDSKLYRLPVNASQVPIAGIDTDTVDLTTFSDGVSIQADVRLSSSNSINLISTSGGVQANLNLDSGGNIPLSIGSSGLSANLNCSSVNSVFNTDATSATPVTAVYGKLSDGTCGYANVTMTNYGQKIPSLTTTQRTSISSSDLYDAMLLFDSTLRKFMWYDAVNLIWVQL